MNQILTQDLPLALATKRQMLDLNLGTPLKRPEGNFKAPEGFSYTDDHDKPTDTVEGYRWQRLLTEEAYTWESVLIPIPEPIYGEVSKRIFYKRMTALGKWKQFKTLIKQDEDVQDLYDNSAALDINDPDVIALSPAIKTELELTDEEYQSLFLVN